MTLHQIASVLTALFVVVILALFLRAGDLRIGVLLLAAPLPLLVLDRFYSEWGDWTIGDLRLRRKGDLEIETDLDQSLRDPLEPVPQEDDGSLFVPGCPALPRTPRSETDG